MIRLLATFALLSASAFANVTVTVSGAYNASSTTNAFTAPNATWTLSFQVANQPAVFTTTSTEFRTLYSNATFTLNGAPVPVTGTTVIFTGTGFNIFLDANVQFIVTAGQMFSGTTSNPTMLPAIYTTTNITSFFPNPHGGFFDGFSTTFSNVVIGGTGVTPPPTPAPPTWLLVATGIGALGLVEHLRRRQANAL
jgi:hypothetical protein